MLKTSINSEKKRISDPPITYPLCPICSDTLKPGGHKYCSGKRVAMANITNILIERNIAEPLAVTIINKTIGRNTINGDMRAANNKQVAITTKRLRTVEITVNECIDFLRDNKFSKKQFRMCRKFAKRCDVNRLTTIPGDKEINSQFLK